MINNTNIYTETSDNSIQKSIYSNGILNQLGTVKFYSGYASGTFSGLYTYENTKTYIYGGTFVGNKHGLVFQHGEGGKAYVENANIICKEYDGKYSDNEFTNSANNGILLGGGTSSRSANVTVYMDSCTIVSERNSINLTVNPGYEYRNNKLYISNSKIDGIINVVVGNEVILGQGMNKSEYAFSGEGSVTENNDSYKGIDKILIQEN